MSHWRVSLATVIFPEGTWVVTWMGNWVGKDGQGEKKEEQVSKSLIALTPEVSFYLSCILSIMV